MYNMSHPESVIIDVMHEKIASAINGSHCFRCHDVGQAERDKIRIDLDLSLKMSGTSPALCNLPRSMNLHNLARQCRAMKCSYLQQWLLNAIIERSSTRGVVLYLLDCPHYDRLRMHVRSDTCVSMEKREAFV
jgi:hypothetical protein